jgi:hypothetical protein
MTCPAFCPCKVQCAAPVGAPFLTAAAAPAAAPASAACWAGAGKATYDRAVEEYGRGNLAKAEEAGAAAAPAAGCAALSPARPALKPPTHNAACRSHEGEGEGKGPHTQLSLPVSVKFMDGRSLEVTIPHRQSTIQGLLVALAAQHPGAGLDPQFPYSVQPVRRRR